MHVTKELSDALDAVARSRIVNHSWETKAGGAKVCSRCGLAKNNKEYKGYKYWFAGVGYESAIPCHEVK